MAKENVYLIDGSGYIFRAYYAVPSLSTSYGFPTNALYAFTKMVLKLLLSADAERVVVCFDVSKDTFRKELYSEYKANRATCPEDLVPQLPFFRSICLALGLAVAEKEGYEADDVIGTLAHRLTDLNQNVVIVTGDKDLMQLVTEDVSVWDTMKDLHYSAKEVKEKWGVEPKSIVDLLGLMGDSSDNIPGVEGVGPKTAVQLIEEYGDVEGVIASIDAIAENKNIRGRAKLAEKIRSSVDILRLSRKLAEIDCQAVVEIRNNDSSYDLNQLDGDKLLDACSRKSPSYQDLQELIEKFEFASLFQNAGFSLVKPPEKLSSIGECQIVYRKDFTDWLAQFKLQQAFSIAVQTKDNIIGGVAFAWQDDRASFIPLAEEGGDLLTPQELFSALKPQFQDKNIKKYCHDLKPVLKLFQKNDIVFNGTAFDTMLASYLLNPDGMEHSLEVLSERYLGISLNLEMDESDQEAEKSACQAQLIWLLTSGMSPMIEDHNLSTLMEEMELPLEGVLAKMELRGIKLDVDALHKMSEVYGKRLEQLMQDIYQEAGCEFNINSPKQLADILFNKLQIPTKGLKKTKTGYSTDSSVLEVLSEQHVLPRYLLEYRMLNKLKNTYIDVLPTLINPETGRLHTTFNQMITGTGRLSSSDPNLQNIPIQTPEGREIRKAFVAEKGRCLISADYSQIELRVLAHLSGDENLIQLFNSDVDIHAQTARELLHIPAMLDVSPAERRIGKTINFGVIYGMSAFRLGQDLGLPMFKAKEYIDNYFNYFHGVQEFFQELEEGAEKNGYVTTMFGRRRNISDVDKTGKDKGFLRRVAVNAPIQGTAADIIKLAMIKLDNVLSEKKLPLEMLLQIHDELVFECDDAFLDEAKQLICEIMENIIPLRVPLRIGIGCGNNWFEAH